MNIDLDQIRELMRSLQEFDIRELELENEEERIVLRRGPVASEAPVLLGAPVGAAGSAPQAPAAPSPGGAPSSSDPADDGDSIFVTSPFVGTFYRSPSPDAPSFVQEGQSVQPGQVLCIVEAMKLMNEIEAEVAGTLVEVLAENGKPVEYGDRLFRLKPA